MLTRALFSSSTFAFKIQYFERQFHTDFGTPITKVLVRFYSSSTSRMTNYKYELVIVHYAGIWFKSWFKHYETNYRHEFASRVGTLNTPNEIFLKAKSQTKII